jgi:sterol desaturase/sphingolipid hydroxylase (fatty acid hydroxylase superfamily)
VGGDCVTTLSFHCCTVLKPIMNIAVFSSWPWWFCPVFCGLVVLGLEIINGLATYAPALFQAKDDRIPVRGKPLERFTWIDYAFIWFNKMITCLFSFNVIQFVYYSGVFDLYPSQVSLLNTFGPIPFMFVVYDLPYYLFHRWLHCRGIYSQVHKHHHRQMAPFRANYDAINVHPFEMIVGEYLHLMTIALVSLTCHGLFGLRMHVACIVIFLALGGFLASLNHTRYTVSAEYLLYDVRSHDQHHVQPKCNYSQYTMLWDIVFGTFEPHPALKVRRKSSSGNGKVKMEG